MRRKSLLLVAFLLSLYIVPMIFTSSYGPSATLTQPNKSKEFSSSGAVEYSTESITSFSETLDDDVLYFPDGWYDDTIRLADYGDGDFDDSWLLDSNRWVVFDDDDPWTPQETAVFYTDCAIVGFEYSAYGFGAYTEGYLQVFDIETMDNVNVTTIEQTGQSGETWYNGTYKLQAAAYSPSKMYIRLACAINETGAAYVAIDYLELRFHYMTLTEYNPSIPRYGDSFFNVSDWAGQGTDAGDSFTSDGDVCSIELGYVGGAADYKGIYTNDPNFNSLVGYYIELRIKKNTSSVQTYVTFYQTDGVSGDRSVNDITPTTSWQTFKVVCDSDPLECIYIGATLDPAESVKIEIDYLRISPSDEMGYQHDCSTTYNTDASSSDGDKITVTDSITFDIDTTTTATLVETDYYPFLDLFVIDGTGNLLIEVSEDGASWATAVSSTAITELTHYRSNINSLGIDVKQIRVNVTSSAILDYIKAYSIANFSYDAGGAESTNDYSYVESGKLVVHTDVYTKWNYDPTLSVAIDPYSEWIVSLSYGDAYFRFRELGDTNTLWDQGITSGKLVGTTLTDFDMLLYGNLEISAIRFWGIVPAWNEVSNIDLTFFVGGWHIISSIILVFTTQINEWGINVFLIFLGLAMIPASVIYFVKGGQDEASMNKVFYCSVAFIFGWALFLGGIFG